MTKQIYVVKRDDRRELLDYEKINKVLIWATEDITNVSASDVAMNAKLQIFDGISSFDIHRVLIQSAVDMITEETPNYQYVASKLVNFLLRKEVFNTYNIFPRLKTFIKENVDRGIYDGLILTHYSEREMDKIEQFIKHKRDEDLTYSGIQQLMDKYLCQDRKTGKHYETPQFMYMLISMTLFANYTGEDRLDKVKKCYEMLSLQKISLPTPILAGVRTPNRQFASCVLVDVADDLDSIAASNHAVLRYISNRAGIGLNFRLRAIGSSVNNGEKVHTGIIPFLKMFESAVKSCSQGGIRGGAATAHYPFWHKEIMDILVLKNNAGNELSRVRRMDHSIQLCRLFYTRFVKRENISLFSANDVPDLYEAFGYDNDKFEELYIKYENDPTINKITIPAGEVMNLLLQERLENGRIYIQNIDNANSHSAFLDKINMSNLCQEVNLPTSPIYDINSEDGEIALCVLAAFNLGAIKSLSELEEMAEYAVRILDFVIEMQDYPVAAAKKMLKRRSIGVGVTNFAYWLAKNNLTYTDEKSLVEIDRLFEHVQYYLLKASNQLAREFGKCEYFDRTKYSKGLLPIDHYNKNVDTLVKRDYDLDWEGLRLDIVRDGLRNSTLTAQMPTESSAVVSNATNGIEAPRKLITTKKSKSGGPLPCVVPEINKLKNKYQFSYEFDNTAMNKVVSIIQKWFDQGISVNHYYDKRQYADNNIPLSEVAKDLLNFYKWGGKQIYYANSKDYKTDKLEDMITSDDKLISEPEMELEDPNVVGCEGGACHL
jgi:ribonucleoside-diphosphate reductase alpha chain